MTLTLAADSVFLLSLYKPLLLMAAACGWAYLAALLEKDQEYYLLPRWLWNSVLLAAAVLGFWLWLLIPFFWLGFPVALLIISGSVVAYTNVRNPKVPEPARWTLSAKKFQQVVDEFQHAQVQKKAALNFLDESGDKIEVPAPNSAAGAAHARLEEIVEFALPRGADRFDIQVSAQKALVTVQVDGFAYPQPNFDPKSAMALVNYLKSTAGLDVQDLRSKQTANLRILAGDHGKHSLSLVTAGSPTELRMSAAIDPQKLSSVSLDQLGLLPGQRQVLDPVLKEQKHVVLVVCPPHEGMTTTLYTFLHGHDPYTQSVVTLEDDIAYQVEGVEHHVLPPGTDNAALARRVAAAARRNPAVMLVGRPLSAEVAKAIVPEAGERRIYAGLHQLDAFRGLAAWIKLVGEASQAAEALSAVVAQRLSRILCKTCRLAYRPDAEALRKLNLPADRLGDLYKGTGRIRVGNREIICPDCAGMGYKGRLAFFEVMVLDPQARALIAANQLDQLRNHLRRQQRMIWLQEAALARVVDQSTSISEINRVLTTTKPAPSGSQAGVTRV